MQNLKLIAASLLALSATACGSIQHSAVVQQPLDRPLTVGTGDVVLRIDKRKSLPNIAGNADLWGRTTSEGFSEVRFAGVEPTGEVVLLRKDVHIESNETTASRMPLSFTSASSLSPTTLTATTIRAGSAYHIPVPSDTIAIRIAPNEKTVIVSGYVVEIVAASANTLTYRATKRTD